MSTGKRPIGVNLRELSDKQIEDLHGDMVRLAQSGTRRQQREAEEALPTIGAEIARRRSTAIEAAGARRNTGRMSNAATARARRFGKPKGSPPGAH